MKVREPAHQTVRSAAKAERTASEEPGPGEPPGGAAGEREHAKGRGAGHHRAGAGGKTSAGRAAKGGGPQHDCRGAAGAHGRIGVGGTAYANGATSGEDRRDDRADREVRTVTRSGEGYDARERERMLRISYHHDLQAPKAAAAIERKGRSRKVFGSLKAEQTRRAIIRPSFRVTLRAERRHYAIALQVVMILLSG